jgi:hypothetical protein
MNPHGPAAKNEPNVVSRVEGPGLGPQKKKGVLQSVGIEPTLLRTRALSVRLNRSAKTAIP